MKTIMSTLMLLAMLAATGGMARGQDSNFELSADGDTLLGYYGPGGEVTVPNGVKVIGETAFKMRYSGNLQARIAAKDTLINVVLLPEGVTDIGAYAFYNCTRMTGIQLPNGLKTIGNYAFAYSGLVGLDFPAGMTTLGERAFRNCTELTNSVTLPEGLISIGDAAFADCASLINVNLPSTLQTIGDSVFWNCTLFAGTVMPEGLTSIGSVAFEYCTYMTSIVIPNSVTNLGNGNAVIRHCPYLYDAVVGDGIKNMGDQFYDCPALKTLVIGKSVENMRKPPFSQSVAPGLQTIVLRCIPYPRFEDENDDPAERLPNRRTLHVREDNESYDRWNETQWATWATEVKDDIYLIYEDTVWLHDTLHHTDTLEVHDTLTDTLEIHDTTVLEIHDTLHHTVTLEVHDTFTEIHFVDVPGPVQYDTFYRIVTLEVHDTVYRDTLLIDVPGPVQYDTIRITVRDTLWRHDTLSEVLEVHDTLSVYIVIDSETGAETVVPDGGRAIDVPNVETWGADMVYFPGLSQREVMEVYDLRGVLLVRTSTQPVYLGNVRGVLIVGQGGKWWKFVR